MRVKLAERLSEVSDVVEELKEASDNVGAICVFLGVVRATSAGERVLKLEYEAHPALAEEVLLKLLEEARERHGIIDGVIEHKVGTAHVGETVMCVAVASEHRKEGFRALAELVDRVKHEAPIWKKEVLESGARWVEGEPGEQEPLIRLRGVLEATVNREVSARELIEALGLKADEVLVMKDCRVLQPHEGLRKGDLVKIVPVALLTSAGG